MHLPLPSGAGLDFSLPNQFAFVCGLVLPPKDAPQHQILIELYGSLPSLHQHHGRKSSEFVRWLYHKTIESQLLCVHVDLKDVGWVSELTHFEDGSPALLRTVSLELADGLVFFLGLRQFASTVGRKVLVYPFLGLLASLGLDLAGVHHKLVLHDYCHVAYSEFGFVGFDEAQFDLVVFLEQFFMLSLPLQLLLLLLGQEHRHHHPRVVVV